MSESGLKVSIKSLLLPYICAQVPVILAFTKNEEEHFLNGELSVLERMSPARPIYRYDISNKLLQFGTENVARLGSPVQVIEWFSQLPPLDPLSAQAAQSSANAEGVNDLLEIGPGERGILFLMDTLFFMQDNQNTGHSNAQLGRAIKTAIPALLKTKRTLVIVGNRTAMPPELDGLVSVVHYPLPDLDMCRQLTRWACNWIPPVVGEMGDKTRVTLTDDEEVEVASLLLGFRRTEAENILARAAQENGRARAVNPAIKPGFDLELIRQAKIEVVSKSAALQITIPRSRDQEAPASSLIGGAGALKEWFAVRRELFYEEARSEGILCPKGAILVGMGGTGKDWAVENLAQDMGWTTLFGDFGAAKGSLQGQSHRQFRDILETAEMQAPCHLIISEIEKMLAGAMSGSSHLSDGGTNAECYATFLNWMQRKTKPIFVWGLTNSITSVAQPLLRAGRWDKIWFMDLPETWEREEIFRIHLEKAGWPAEKYEIDLICLAERSAGYTGAEIERVVQEGIILKFIRDGRGKSFPIKTEHFLEALSTIPSTQKMRGQEVEALRQYALDGNIQRANSPDPSKSVARSGKKIGKKIIATL